MKKNITFFSVLISNLKCAFCSDTYCSVRYYPQRRNFYFYNGKKYYDTCKKDEEKYYDKIFKC